MGEMIKLVPGCLTKIRNVDSRLMSYNIEMTEVTGGTFWKAYTPGQIAGTEEFEGMESWEDMGALMQVYPPIDLYNEKLRTLAKAFGPVWIRVSGTWANKTYYDFDGSEKGVAPEGFQNVLTEVQWRGVLDFVKEMNAKLLISVANCAGIHGNDEPWNPSQAKLIFDYSRDYGVPIAAVEFTNEPNMLNYRGMPDGYSAEDYARDQDIFFRWVRENYPDTLIVGPCAIGDANLGMESDSEGIQVAEGMKKASTEELLRGTTEPLDIFSYHYYNGVSERGGAMASHWPAELATTEEYLAVAAKACKTYMPVRDKYAPGCAMWVTESGDAGCGGNTWASTFLDVLRTANELGSFPLLTDGVIFHNTLASSDYGFLAHTTFEPRPNYWFALLWTRLMGTTVFDTKEEDREGAHVYAHSRKDGKDGMAYMIINNSTSNGTTVVLPGEAEIYTLSAESLRSSEIMLNGKVLESGEDGRLPELIPDIRCAGKMTLEPCTVTFILI